MDQKIGEVKWKCELTHQVDMAGVYRHLDTGAVYVCKSRPAGSEAPFIELADYKGGFFRAMLVPDGFGPDKELGWDGVLR